MLKLLYKIFLSGMCDAHRKHPNPLLTFPNSILRYLWCLPLLLELYLPKVYSVPLHRPSTGAVKHSKTFLSQRNTRKSLTYEFSPP